jgi:hypothetical protein
VFRLAAFTPEDKTYLTFQETLPNGMDQVRSVTLEDVRTICTFNGVLSVALEDVKGETKVAIGLHVADDIIVNMESADGALLEAECNAVEDALQLQELPKPATRKSDRLLFFLSYRFDAKSRSAPEKIQKFLGLLAVNVITERNMNRVPSLRR